MLFNSIEFAYFLPIVFFIYWALNKKIRVQNCFIIIASYLFYGLWNWKFLSLIIFSSLIDFIVGIYLEKKEKRSTRKMLLLLSICMNLGFLIFFKYYNFFAESFADVFTLFGQKFDTERLNIILPVGISFYTFQTLSYSIDVYNKKLKPTRDWTAFFAFVSFFPQLVAGPIERASNLLPQFYEKRHFILNTAKDGMRQVLWGLFKKIVIADNCAHYANKIFDDYEIYSGSTLFIGALFFTFQIYCDFSGYSDIAIGTSKLFGFKLMKNFSVPYFSRDIAEFWRRWHISLSTWFRDYVYIPLGGSKGSLWMKVRNTFIIFILSGFWHGANWTFIFWGLLNALYFLPLLLTKRNRVNTNIVAQNSVLPTFKEALQIGITFFITVIAWIFFRAENLPHAFNYIKSLFSKSLFTIPEVRPSSIFVLIFALLCIEWIQRKKEHSLHLNISSKPLRWSIYYVLIIVIFIFSGREQEFIYFQF